MFSRKLLSVISLFLLFFCANVMADSHTKNFNTDVYIAVAPVPEQPDYLAIYYSPRDMIFIKKSSLGSDGIVKLDKTVFEGAPEFKSKLEKVFVNANKAFDSSGAAFELRDIYIIDVNQANLKKHFKANDNELSLSVEDDKSGLLADFDEASAGSKNAFKVLMGDISDDAGERGRGEDGGHVSVVHMGSVMEDGANGQILVHELGHNLGLEHVAGKLDNPFEYAMASKETNRRAGTDRNRASENKLTDAQQETIKSRLHQYSAFEVGAAPTSAAAKKTSKMKKSKKGKTVKKVKKAKAKTESKAPKAIKKAKKSTPKKRRVGKKQLDHSYVPSTIQSSNKSVNLGQPSDASFVEMQTPYGAVNYKQVWGNVTRDNTFLPLRWEREQAVSALFPSKRKEHSFKGYSVTTAINTGAFFPTIAWMQPQQNKVGLYSITIVKDEMKTDADFSADSVPAMGADLGILSPLDNSAGIIVGASDMGFSDISSLNYRDAYKERKIMVTGEIYQFTANDVFFAVRVGGMWGENTEQHDLQFTTAAGGLRVHQYDKLDVERYAGIIGVHASMPVLPHTAFHIDADYRSVRNKVDVKSALDTNGLLTVTDRIKVSDKKNDKGFRLATGISISVSKNLGITGSVALESWDIPMLEHAVDSVVNTPITVSWKDRRSWVAALGVVLEI